MYEFAVRETLWAQRPDEDIFELHIQIGVPYQVDGVPEEWACPMSLAPLHARRVDIRGGGAFQALCLASSLVLQLLSDFKAQGGKVFIAPGEEMPLEAYGFGASR